MSTRQLPVVAQLIRKHRVTAGLSQEELAERSGVSARAVSDLERGLRATPRLETLRMLADSLPMSSEDRAALFSAARPGVEVSGEFKADSTPVSSRPTMLPLRLKPIPSLLSGLVGQDDVIQLVEAHLGNGQHRLISLIGPGGVGKTHVCTEIAHRVAHSYLDGAAFVDLSALQEADLVTSAIASALGLDTGGGHSALESVSDALRHRNLLLVLDNFEHLLAAAPAISSLLGACPNLTMLVTSRVRLRVRGEQTVTISPLPVPPQVDRSGAVSVEEIEKFPAVRLFLERAREADAEFPLEESQLAIVGEICRRLDGLPLAIELAASRTNIYSPETLLERLDRRFPAMTGGRRDAPERQQTLASTIGWSYELLGSAVQRMFRRLAVFSGGWTLDAAARVATDPGEDAARMIEILADHSLIRSQRGGPLADRFTMLETVREFAEASLLESGESFAIRARHRDWCLELANLAGNEFAMNRHDQFWYTTLDSELANLRTSLAFMREIGDGSGVLHLFRDIAFYWNDRPYYREMSHWFDWAMEQDPAQPLEFTARVQGTRAFLASSFGEHDLSRHLIDSMLSIVDQDGTPELRCFAYSVQGSCIEYTGDIEGAAATYARSMEACEECGALLDLVDSKREVADKWILLGNVAAAVELLDECLEVARAEDAGTHIAHALGARALAALAQHDLMLTADLSEEYLDLAMRYRIDRDILGAIAGMAALALAIDKPFTAAHLLGAVESARQSIGIARVFNQLHAERTLAALRDLLGPDALIAALGEGASMTYDEAIAAAREVASLARDSNQRWTSG